jgi:hypothetical protein
MFEARHQRLLSRRQFYVRLLRSCAAAVAIVLGSLAIGVGGYHHFEHLSWLDSLLNASMILSSMGPVAPLQTDEGKLFASFYALFSGVAFITMVGVLSVPIAHRLLHKFHLELEAEDRQRVAPHSVKREKTGGADK